MIETRRPAESSSGQHTVVHVFPTFAVGGAQVRFAALANRFGRAFRHIVVALDGETGCRERLNPDLDVSFPAIDAPKNAMLANAWRFRRQLKAWAPDVLVTYNWGAIEFAIANLPGMVRHLHVVDGFGPEERETQLQRRVLIRRMVLRRGIVVVPSRTLERIATEIWKLPRGIVRYVPNGVDLGRFVPRPPGSASVGPLTIGTVAALRAEKNLGRLLRAFAEVARDRPARLEIVGDGAERAGLEALAAELGIAGLVDFLGHRDDTPGLYTGFDVFALTSDTEQMPLSVIEAMAAGLPIVATDVGDVRAMVSERNTDCLVPKDDAAMAAMLARVLDDPAERMAMGRANREKAERDFAQEGMFSAWWGLLSGEEGGISR